MWSFGLGKRVPARPYGKEQQILQARISLNNQQATRLEDKHEFNRQSVVCARCSHWAGNPDLGYEDEELDLD
jgi:hypothetical protein